LNSDAVVDDVDDAVVVAVDVDDVVDDNTVVVFDDFVDVNVGTDVLGTVADDVGNADDVEDGGGGKYWEAMNGLVAC